MPFQLPIITYHSTYFSLSIHSMKKKTLMTMRLFTEMMNTAAIPETFSILTSRLPSIFTSTCYNDEALPFATEVLQTEIGHLFEHIILEYLCRYKIESGEANAIYSGLTRWDWHSDPRGVFHITLTAGSEDIKILGQAIDQSIHLLSYIIAHKPQIIPVPQPSNFLFAQSQKEII